MSYCFDCKSPLENCQCEYPPIKPRGWTRTPPSEPGWYRVAKYGDVGFVYLTENQTILIAGMDCGRGLHHVDYWWSHPETLPPLPKEGE
jgi:hypothetical protein